VERFGTLRAYKISVTKTLREEKMKKILTLLVVLAIVGLMSAQETIVVEGSMDEIEEALEAAVVDIEARIDSIGDSKTITVTMDGTEGSAKRAYLGVYYEDLSLKKARELNYPNNFGVLITGTGAGSAAHQFGLAADDILMEIDGKKCIDKDKFVKIISAYMPDQTVKFKIFSNEVEREFDLTFGHRPEPKKKTLTKKQLMKKKRTSYPAVEGMYTPIWYVMDDVDDLNSVFTQMGFKDLDENGTLYNGFAIRANIGKGVYIGGTFAGYSLTRKVKHDIETNSIIPNNDEANELKGGKATVNTVRRMNFESGWGAVTIDKKFMLAKWLQPSLGVALGGGSQQIEFTQTDGGYDWDQLNTEFDDGSNNAMTMTRNYFIVQPKADIYIKIISWLGIRIEGSYMLGYSATKGWTETSGDYLIDNSPDTTMNGYAISAGPWIQF
jgi:hypothetical protein